MMNFWNNVAPLPQLLYTTGRNGFNLLTSAVGNDPHY